LIPNKLLLGARGKAASGTLRFLPRLLIMGDRTAGAVNGITNVMELEAAISSQVAQQMISYYL
jgi:hypothetical protein